VLLDQAGGVFGFRSGPRKAVKEEQGRASRPHAEEDGEKDQERLHGGGLAAAMESSPRMRSRYMVAPKPRRTSAVGRGDLRRKDASRFRARLGGGAAGDGEGDAGERCGRKKQRRNGGR
jgi:hypothetical protein